MIYLTETEPSAAKSQMTEHIHAVITLRHAVTLTFDPLIMNVYCRSGVTWSDSVPKLTDMGWSAAELLIIRPVSKIEAKFRAF